MATTASCPTYTEKDFERVKCIAEEALRKARAALADAERAYGLVPPGADVPPEIFEPRRFMRQLELAISVNTDADFTDNLDELLRAYVAHRGHPGQLLGGIDRTLGKLTTASFKGALALARHPTAEQYEAWEWTTQAIERLCQLWRPVAECYFEKRVPSFTLPTPRPAPPC
jgi:hypothetical protein